MASGLEKGFTVFFFLVCFFEGQGCFFFFFPLFSGDFKAGFGRFLKGRFSFRAGFFSFFWRF